MDWRRRMIIHKAFIELNPKSKNKEEISEDLTPKAGKLGRSSAVTSYIEVTFIREEYIFTAIGCRIAVPHGESRSVPCFHLQSLTSKRLH